MTYPTYPTYPPNSRYNPWRSYEQAAANAEAAPEQTPPRGLWTGRYGFVFAVVAICVTLVALVLAFLASGLTPHAASPSSSGMTRVFDGLLTDDGQWDNTGACSFTPAGLDVSSSAGAADCQYSPSVGNDLTSQGFILEATLAPAASVQGPESAEILAGGTSVELTQQGSFSVCAAPQLPCGTGTPSSTGATDAWHTDAYVSNTIQIRYSAGDARVTVSVNGQQIAALPVSQTSGPIALGSGVSGEALYTHAALYSASGS